MKSKSAWDALERIRAAANFDPEDPAPGRSKSINEYAHHFHLSRSSADRELRALVKAGKMRQGKRTDRDARGRRCVVECFWPA